MWGCGLCTLQCVNYTATYAVTSVVVHFYCIVDCKFWPSIHGACHLIWIHYLKLNYSLTHICTIHYFFQVHIQLFSWRLTYSIWLFQISSWTSFCETLMKLALIATYIYATLNHLCWCNATNNSFLVSQHASIV